MIRSHIFGSSIERVIFPDPKSVGISAMAELDGFSFTRINLVCLEVDVEEDILFLSEKGSASFLNVLLTIPAKLWNFFMIKSRISTYS